MTPINSFRFRIRSFVAIHRTSITILIGAVHSAALAFAVTEADARTFWIATFIFTSVVLVIANLVPSRYQKVQLLQSFMELIHRAMSFDAHTERVTVHHVVSHKRQKYEQLTNYYPSGVGRGRSYFYSSGIVGAAIKNKMPRVYSVPANMTWEEAMIRDWAFDRDELARLTKDRMSYFTFPILDASGSVVAVLFCDSADRLTFTEANKASIEAKVKQWFEPQLRLLLED